MTTSPSIVPTEPVSLVDARLAALDAHLAGLPSDADRLRVLESERRRMVRQYANELRMAARGIETVGRAAATDYVVYITEVHKRQAEL